MASLGLDALIAPWLVALRTAQSAIETAGSGLGPLERGEHAARLERQRRDMAQRLRLLAREQHVDSPLLAWLDDHRLTLAMLGLPTEVTACVFDLDGVLTTSATMQASVWAQMFDSFLLDQAERSHTEFTPFDRLHEYPEYIAGRPRLAGVRGLLFSRGIHLPEGSGDDPPGAETVHGLANRKNILLQIHLEQEGVAAFAGSRSYLIAARMLGLRRAVVSESANAGTILSRAGLADLIDELVDATTIESDGLRQKPAPDCLLAACERLGARPDQTVAFEINPLGIAAARAAGVRLAIAVDRDGQAQALRASGPDLVIRDLAELLAHARPGF